VCPTCTTYLVQIDLTTLIIFGERYKL
jgi:hypothetical protein